MSRSFLRDLSRTIRRSTGRFLALFGIVALGAGFFAGLSATAPDMRETADRYCDENRLMDVRLLSTVGFTDDDIAAIRATEGVEAVMPSHTADVMLRVGDQEVIARVHGLPEDRGADDAAYLNRPVLASGRLPENPGECVVSESKTMPDLVKVGDTLRFEETDGELSDTFRYREYRVVGLVADPYYLAFSLGSTSMGNGMLNYFVYIPDGDFAQEVYTDVYASVTGAADLNAFSDGYETLVDGVSDRLETLAPTQTDARYADARRKLDDGWEEYREQKADVERELSDAQRELSDAARKIADNEAKLSDGRSAYEDGVRELASQKADVNRQLSEAQEKLDDGRAELESGKQQAADGVHKLVGSQLALNDAKEEAEAKFQEAEAQLSEAKTQIDEGRAQLDRAKAQLAEAREEFERQSADANVQLADAAAQLDQAEAELQKNEEELNEGERQYADGMDGLAQLEAGLDSLEAQLAALPPTDPAYAALEARVAGMQATYDSTKATLDGLRSTLDDGKTQLEAGKTQLAQGRAAYETQAGEAGAELAAAEKQLSDAQRELDQKEAEWSEGQKTYARNLKSFEAQKAEAQTKFADAQRKIDDGWTEANAGQKKLSDSQHELDAGQAELGEKRREALSGFADGERKLAQSKKELADGEQALQDAKKELADGQAEYERQKADAESALDEAQQKLSDGENDVEKLRNPEWYVLDRDTNAGFASLKSDADRMASLATVFPILFFIVAALVALTTMTRMVEEERGLIGTYKALGYGNGAIMSKYLLYAAVPSVAGSAAGILVGFQILPRTIWNAYLLMYTAPAMTPGFVWRLALSSSLVSVLCTLAATYFACRSTLRESPAALMLPKAPKAGKRILLERIGPLWSRLSFTHKVTARNLFRYKRRLIMTVVGIAGCTGLMVTGFGIKDSVSAIVGNQYNEIFRYNATVELDGGRLGDGARAVLDDPAYVSSYLRCERSGTDVGFGDKSVAAYLIVPEDTSRLGDFVLLRERRSRETVPFDDNSVVLTEKLAKLLDVGVGDEVSFKDGEGRNLRLTVTGITENYVYHYIYVAPELYRRATGGEPEYNQVLAAVDGDTQAQQQVSDLLLSKPGVDTVAFTGDIVGSFDDMLESLNYVILVLIVAAGMLAFIVLYNLTNINVTERQREIATIKVLGFYNREVGAYIYRETALLTLIGCVLGLALGVLMHRYVIQTAEVDFLMFGRVLKAPSFLWAAALTLLFSAVVNFAMYGKLKKIDMVESLKSVD